MSLNLPVPTGRIVAYKRILGDSPTLEEVNTAVKQYTAPVEAELSIEYDEELEYCLVLSWSTYE
jgi:hypothetical protein